MIPQPMPLALLQFLILFAFLQMQSCEHRDLRSQLREVKMKCSSAGVVAPQWNALDAWDGPMYESLLLEGGGE